MAKVMTAEQERKQWKKQHSGEPSKKQLKRMTSVYTKVDEDTAHRIIGQLEEDDFYDNLDLETVDKILAEYQYDRIHGEFGETYN